MGSAMKVGDRVHWECVRGGYAFVQSIAAVVDRIGPRRVRIRVAMRCPGQDWQIRHRWVQPQSLRPRQNTVAVVDNEITEEDAI